MFVVQKFEFSIVMSTRELVHYCSARFQISLPGLYLNLWFLLNKWTVVPLHEARILAIGIFHDSLLLSVNCIHPTLFGNVQKCCFMLISTVLGVYYHYLPLRISRAMLFNTRSREKSMNTKQFMSILYFFREESKWSKAIYTYISATFILSKKDRTKEENAKVDELMR